MPGGTSGRASRTTTASHTWPSWLPSYAHDPTHTSHTGGGGGGGSDGGGGVSGAGLNRDAFGRSVWLPTPRPYRRGPGPRTHDAERVDVARWRQDAARQPLRRRVGDGATRQRGVVGPGDDARQPQVRDLQGWGAAGGAEGRIAWAAQVSCPPAWALARRRARQADSKGAPGSPWRCSQRRKGPGSCPPARCAPAGGSARRGGDAVAQAAHACATPGALDQACPRPCTTNGAAAAHVDIAVCDLDGGRAGRARPRSGLRGPPLGQLGRRPGSRKDAPPRPAAA
jgi:hypothetical protein